MQKVYKHLFFDLDHTLWDFEANSEQVLMILFEEFDLKNILKTDASTFFQEFSAINELLWAKYRKGFIKREFLRWKRFAKTFQHFGYLNDELAKEMSENYLVHLPKQNKLLPYAKEILDYCKAKNYEMHIITNGFEITQYEKMANANITDYFKEVITSEQCNSLKPSSIIFEFAHQATGATPKNSLMIGDSWEADILGAKDYGMDQVFYNPNKLSFTDKATYEINCLSELKAIV